MNIFELGTTFNEDNPNPVYTFGPVEDHLSLPDAGGDAWAVINLQPAHKPERFRDFPRHRPVDVPPPPTGNGTLPPNSWAS